MTPYPHPCFATFPTARNQITGGEPPSSSNDRFSSRPNPPRHPPNTVTPPLAGMWARANGAIPMPLTLAGQVGPPARVATRACPGWAESPHPPSPVSQENPFPFIFPIFFSHFHIYVYILIFYAPKIVQIFYMAQNNNI
jgi:hypothetical protein